MGGHPGGHTYGNGEGTSTPPIEPLESVSPGFAQEGGHGPWGLGPTPTPMVSDLGCHGLLGAMGTMGWPKAHGTPLLWGGDTATRVNL